ncbi:olfactory receptor 13A1 [Cricetulus griseus]|uniref:olfactory receptor 13A1 n=1 Tax=Cricetulus griseus TaxID=10029 RepID=UPI00022F68EB|nr:olfactory receptor 13A1 [Cricetulus griseus]
MAELTSCLLVLTFISTDFTHSVLKEGFGNYNEKMNTLMANLNCLTEPDTFSGRQKPPPGPGKGVIYIYPTGLITHKEWLRVTKKKWTVVDRVAHSPMAMNNYTSVVEFVLQGFSGDPGFQAFFLAFFFLFYILALAGNTLIIMAISLNPSLHTPMYFFLANLALLDIVCTSTVLPKLLEGLVGKGSHISYKGCMTQLFFLTWFLGAELLLLTAMAYDRYVAICRPLHYSLLMSRPVCVLLAGSVWLISAVNSSVHTGLMAQLDFCGPNKIRHFFCEIPPLLKLSCAPTQLNEAMAFAADVFLAVGNFSVIILSYGFIVASILRIRSAEGKRRAFSTCSAHLIVVTMYYSTVIYTYICPASSYSLNKDKVASVIYTSVAPTLNPLIYTLRNKDVKVALRRLLFCY